MPKSNNTLCIENLSSVTRCSDIRYELERFGQIEDIERDKRERCALVRFERPADAAYAWKKADGIKVDGRAWRVEWATDKDFNFFGWKWEGDSFATRSRSASPLPKKTPADEDKQANME